MSLEEKIKKEKEILERKKHQYEGDMKSSDAYKEKYKDEIASLKEEIEEHESLVTWLEELKELRLENSLPKTNETIARHVGYESGYNKAVDDFAGVLKTKYQHYDIDDVLDTSKYYSYKDARAKLEKYVDEIAKYVKDNTLDNDYDNYDR